MDRGRCVPASPDAEPVPVEDPARARVGTPFWCPNEITFPRPDAHPPYPVPTAEYYRLRTVHRLIGAMVGGLPGFRQQDQVHGLPLQLSPEEVTLAVSRGWVTLYEAPDPLADVTADEGGAPPAKEARRPPQANRKGWGVKPKPGQGAKKAWGDAGGDGDVARMLANTSFVTVPLREPDEGDGEREEGDGRTVQWTYPRTWTQRARCAVFADLHDRGLTMTTGIKFGADFLAYPGDPMAYHAGFCVRVVPDDAHMRCQHLSGWARTAHGARKNLVLASAVAAGNDGDGDDGRLRVEYLTVMPDVEQSSNARYRKV